MPEVKKILFPIELAPISDRIAPYAKYYADKLGAELHVIHVLADPHDMCQVYLADSTLTKAIRDMELDVKAQVEEFCRKHGLEAKVAILMGSTVDVILDYITENDIDQVIAGTHGRKTLEKILLGSVTRRLVRRSPAPVLTINPYLIGRGK